MNYFNKNDSVEVESFVFKNFYENSNYNSNIIDDIYYNKIFNIINNTKLVKLINNKKIKINKLDNINNYYNWKTIKKDSDLITNDIIVQNKDSSNGVFYCSKCKKDTKCSFYTKQTRSADEGFTSFITCSVCNHTWREN